MLTIRFSRTGKKRKPFYRIIISEKKKSPTSSYLELLGHYDPRTKKAVLKADRIKHWIERGSTLSNSIFNLLLKEGVITSETKRRSVFVSQKRQGTIDEKKGVEKKEEQAEPVSENSADATSEQSDKKPESAGADTAVDKGKNAPDTAKESEGSTEKEEKKPKTTEA